MGQAGNVDKDEDESSRGFRYDKLDNCLQDID